tara:strand:- start:809 stop:1033 length:225 start_codon:yes stop_codon:yes gene_type:complete
MIALLGWLGTSFILLGYYLNAKQSVTSWIVWFIGNTLMLIYSIFISAEPQVALAIALLCLNVYGYLEWRKNDNK